MGRRPSPREHWPGGLGRNRMAGGFSRECACWWHRGLSGLATCSRLACLSPRLAHVLVLLLSLAGQAAARDADVGARWRMGAVERATWAQVDPAAVHEPKAVEVALGALAARATPAERAMLLFFRCRNALRNGLPEIRRVEAELVASRAIGEAGLQKCQQLRALAKGQVQEAFGRSFGAYHAVDATVPALLAGWIAYDYAQDALDAGLHGDALDAAAASLAFARANRLVSWEAETRGVVALVRGHMGQFDAALADNASALRLTGDAEARENLVLNRGYLLRLAKREEAARAEYEKVLGDEGATHAHRLMALANVGMIDLQAGRTDRVRDALRRMRDLLSRQPVEALEPYPQILQAHLLLSEGRVAEAVALHARGMRWFEDRNYDFELLEQLEAWSDALRRRGRTEEALVVLREAVAQRKRKREAERRDSAALVEAVLSAEQRRFEYLALKQRHDASLAEIERRKSKERMLAAFSLVVMAFLWGLFAVNRRLRATKRRLAEKNAQLDYESTHDALTRMLNRRAFLQFLDGVLPQLPEQPALLVMVDIDHFKKINDTRGHRAGDEVLQELSTRLAGMLRNTDRVARWGGEEFLLYIHAPPPGQVVALLSRLLARVGGEPFAVSTGSLHVTASAGFGLVSAADRAAFEKALDAIDADLYVAKRNGRNRAVGSVPGDGRCEIPGPG